MEWPVLLVTRAVVLNMAVPAVRMADVVQAVHGSLERWLESSAPLSAFRLVEGAHLSLVRAQTVWAEPPASFLSH